MGEQVYVLGNLSPYDDMGWSDYIPETGDLLRSN
jgi:hypothetical protein